MLVDGPDGQLWVEVHGEGSPVTVFTHGMTGSTDEIAPLAAATPGTAVLMDFRGHGRSFCPPPEAGYDHPAYRADLEAVANRFAASQAVGLSVGAGAILNLLADQPDRFERVVLVSPASIDAENAGAGNLFLEMADRLERDGLDAVLAWSLDGNALVAQRPYWRALIKERVRRMNTVGIPRALRGYVHGRPPLTPDAAAALSAVRAPTLILAHEGDPTHDIEIARRLATLLPNATLRTWSEPLAQWDDLDAFATLIANFLGGGDG